MTVIALRPRTSRPADVLGRRPDPLPEHPRLQGRFRSPTGGGGTLCGSMRMERLLLTPQGAFVSGIVTGQLSTVDGDLVGLDSKPVTTAVDLVHEDGRTTAVVRPFELHLMGIPVRVSRFALEPAVVLADGGGHGERHEARPSARAAGG